MGMESLRSPGGVPEETKDLGDGLVDFATFTRVDMRTGTVTKAESVPKSDKLLKLEVYFGAELGSRVILAGIAQDYPGESVVGRSIVAVVNLPPRKMMGHMSNGMLLASKAANGSLCLAICPGVPDGSRLG